MNVLDRDVWFLCNDPILALANVNLVLHPLLTVQLRWVPPPRMTSPLLVLPGTGLSSLRA